jgi:uncharacterized protein YecA (UPF0149 family)
MIVVRDVKKKIISKRKDSSMDTRNGNIMTAEQANLLNVMMGKQVAIEMKINPTKKQLERKVPKVGRNEPCPCGSGLKFKKCHLVGAR